MNETKGLVKCILGFVLSIVVIVGAYFGLDVQVNVEDAAPSPPEVVETTEEVVETEQSAVETTETVDEEIPVEESVEN